MMVDRHTHISIYERFSNYFMKECSLLQYPEKFFRTFRLLDTVDILKVWL